MLSNINIFKNNTVKKGIGFTVFATISSSVNFLLIFILSMYLSKEDFGMLNLFNTTVLVISILISLGTVSYYGPAYFKKTREDFVRIYNVIIIISFVVFLFFGIIVLCASDRLTIILGFNTRYQIYILLFCLLQLFYTFNLEIYRYEENVIKYGFLSLLWVILNFSLTVLFCISLNQGWTGRVDAQLLSAIILFGVNLFILRKKGFLEFKKPQKSHYVETLRFGLPLLPHNSTGWIKQGLDRYFINFFYGATIVGTFSFAYNLSSILLMVGAAFNATNSVYIFKNLTNYDESVKQRLVKQAYLMSLLFFIVALVGYWISYFIIIGIIPKYTDSIPFLFPLFLSAFFQCIYLLFVNYLLYYSKTQMLMYITFSISILHFGFSFLSTKYSPLYTAYVSALSSFLTCVFIAYFAHKTLTQYFHK